MTHSVEVYTLLHQPGRRCVAQRVKAGVGDAETLKYPLGVEGEIRGIDSGKYRIARALGGKLPKTCKAAAESGSTRKARFLVLRR